VALSPEITKEMEHTLLAGGYSLLLGAGVSFDSTNKKGNLPLGDGLRKELVTLKTLRSGSLRPRTLGARNRVTGEAARRLDRLRNQAVLARSGVNLWRMIF
jgi:hypothetical protein